jgi:hypothetical protein
MPPAHRRDSTTSAATRFLALGCSRSTIFTAGHRLARSLPAHIGSVGAIDEDGTDGADALASGIEQGDADPSAVSSAQV